MKLALLCYCIFVICCTASIHFITLMRTTNTTTTMMMSFVVGHMCCIFIRSTALIYIHTIGQSKVLKVTSTYMCESVLVMRYARYFNRHISLWYIWFEHHFTATHSMYGHTNEYTTNDKQKNDSIQQNITLH